MLLHSPRPSLFAERLRSWLLRSLREPDHRALRLDGLSRAKRFDSSFPSGCTPVGMNSSRTMTDSSVKRVGDGSARFLGSSPAFHIPDAPSRASYRLAQNRLGSGPEFGFKTRYSESSSTRSSVSPASQSSPAHREYCSVTSESSSNVSRYLPAWNGSGDLLGLTRPKTSGGCLGNSASSFNSTSC